MARTFNRLAKKQQQEEIVSSNQEMITHPLFSIKQHQHVITTTIELSEKNPYVFKGFFIEHRETKEQYDFESKDLGSDRFSFEFDLVRFANEIVPEGGAHHFEFYFSAEYFVEDEWYTKDEAISLDLFEHFDAVGLSQIEADGNQFFPYFSLMTTGFTFSMNIPIRSNRYIEDITVDQIKVKKKYIDVKGKALSTAIPINRVDTIMVSRNSGARQVIHSNHILDFVEKGTHLHHYDYHIRIDIPELAEVLLLNDYGDDDFDLYFDIYLNGFFKPTTVKVANPSLVASQLVHRDSFIHYGQLTYTFSPLFTEEYAGLTIRVTRFDKHVYQYFKELLPIVWLLRLFYLRRKIWVIGEKPDEAHNTGYYFYKYMREQHPEKEVYYVIDPDSKEYQHVAQFGEENLLPYKSKKHIFHLLMSQSIFTTYAPEEIYPSHTRLLKPFVRGHKIYLQSGVLGTQNVSHVLDRFSSQFETDLFLVNSKRERTIVLKDLHYLENQIAITGLSRFDELFDTSTDLPVKRQVLLFPSDHETGLHYQNEMIDAIAAEFLAVVSKDSFKKFFERNELTTMVCLPQSMEHWTQAFQDVGCAVTLQSDIQTIPLMKESLMMITDYAPEALDFSFLTKPVLFYQFEHDYQVAQQETNMTYGLELPGEIADTQEGLLHFLNQLAVTDFQMSSGNRHKADHLIEYRDTHARERIYEAATQFRRKFFRFGKLKQHPFMLEWSVLWEKFKKKIAR